MEDQKLTFKKFGEQEWAVAETPLLEDIKNILRVVMELKSDDSFKLKQVSDDLYLKFREPLVKRGVLPKIEIEKKQKQTLKKAELIIEQNSKRIFDDLFKKIENENYTSLFNCSYVDIRLIALLYQTVKDIDICSSEETIYQIIYSLRKLTIAAKAKKFPLNQICFQDLEYVYTKLRDKFNFTFQKLFENYPEVITITTYDKLIPYTNAKAYPSQIELIDEITRNKNILVFNDAFIGGGKTSSILRLASKLMEMKRTDKVQRQILFTCVVDVVRMNVAQMCANMSVPFGVAAFETRNGKRYLRIINNYNCKKDEDRIVIISDIISAHAILNSYNPTPSNEIILFMDEPTVGADQDDNPITKQFVEMMKRAPARTILCSATLPSPDQIPNLVKSWKDQWDGKVVTVTSRETEIGCSVFDKDGYQILPHHFIDSGNDMKTLIDKISKSPFLGRFYTGTTLFRMADQMEEVLEDVQKNLNKSMVQQENLNQSGVQNIALALLNWIDDDDELNEIKKPFKIDPIKMESIFTSDSHRFIGGCLIITTSPIQWINNYQHLIDEFPIDKMLKQYQKLKERNEKVKEKAFNKAASVIRKNTASDRSGNKDETEITKKAQQKIDEKMNEEDSITEKIPFKYQPNTRDYLKTKNINTKNAVVPVTLEDIPDTDPLLASWLAKGVGIYDKSLEPLYLQTVISLAQKNKLAFVVGDTSLAYGVNLPIANIILDDSIADKHSIKTIYQLMGRAGRRGYSAYANIYLCGDKIKEMIRKDVRGEIEDREAININSIN